MRNLEAEGRRERIIPLRIVLPRAVQGKGSGRSMTGTFSLIMTLPFRRPGDFGRALRMALTEVP